jgi:hypothetical protein
MPPGGSDAALPLATEKRPDASAKLRSDILRSNDTEVPKGAPKFDADAMAWQLSTAPTSKVSNLFEQAVNGYRRDHPTQGAEQFALDLNEALQKNNPLKEFEAPALYVNFDERGLVRLENTHMPDDHRILAHGFVGQTGKPADPVETLLFDTARELQRTSNDSSDNRRQSIYDAALASYRHLSPDQDPERQATEFRSKLMPAVAVDRAWSMDFWGLCTMATRLDIKDAFGKKFTPGNAPALGRQLSQDPDFERVYGQLEPNDIGIREHTWLGNLALGSWRGKPDLGHAFIYLGPAEDGAKIIINRDGSAQVIGKNLEAGDQIGGVVANQGTPNGSWYFASLTAYRYVGHRK